MSVQVTGIARALAVAALSVVALGPAVGQVTKPHPYTAQFRTTRVQTLANGATITTVSTQTRVADSQGRTLIAQATFNPGSADVIAVSWVTVYDPVESTRIMWSEDSRQARVIRFPLDQSPGCQTSGTAIVGHRQVMPRTTAHAISPASPAATPAPPEDLGVETIQGIEAHGYRTTRTIPTGQVGNDRPLVTVVESWRAPSLDLELRHIEDGPESGRIVMELVSIDLNEPPVSTFQPPEGFEVTSDDMHTAPCREVTKP